MGREAGTTAIGLALLNVLFCSTPVAAEDYAWLEPTHDKRALAWVAQQNKRTEDALKTDPRYPKYYRAALAAGSGLDQEMAAPSESMMIQGWVYNVSRNPQQPRGIWRRAPLASFEAGQPQWQTLLDLDQLSRREGSDYFMWVRFMLCRPAGVRCMVALSVGAAPTTRSWREFDLEKRAFVEGGFVIPERATFIDGWLDDSTLLVENGSTIKRWRRGQSLEQADVFFRSPPDPEGRPPIEAAASMWTDPHSAQRSVLISVIYDRYRSQVFRYDGGERFARLSLSEDGGPQGVYAGQLIVRVGVADWNVGTQRWPAGSVVSVPLASAHVASPEVTPLRLPGPREAVASGAFVTRDGVLMSLVRDAHSELWGYRFDGQRWKGQRATLPQGGVIFPALMADSAERSAFTTYSSLVQVPTLYAVKADGEARPIASQSASFDTQGLMVEQLEAVSRDGTRVPYTIARPKKLRYDGQAPTLLHGYGGLGGVELPSYDSAIGALWLAHGGVYVNANIRGGGELGPAWHVTRAERERVYEDFIAVAEDLIKRRITSPSRLGMTGISNGGLLMGVMLTQRPELFGAVVIKAAVLDLFRLDLVAGGTDWYAREYGSPQVPQERAVMEKTSPFQNLYKVTPFPRPLILTSTTDDNVRPAGPRRFAAKIESLNLPYLFYETPEGGHGLASTPQGQAELNALIYTYLAQQLKL